MESAQEQRKRKGGESSGSGGAARADVFDALGNDGLKAQVAEARTQALPEEEPSILALAEAEAEQVAAGAETAFEEQPQIGLEQPLVEQEAQEQAAVELEPPEVADLVSPEEVPESAIPDQEEEHAQVEQAEALTRQEEPETAAALAAATGVDPVLAMDPKDLGSSDDAKEKALGAEGAKKIEEAVTAATITFGAGSVDAKAQELVATRLREELDVDEILEARREDRLDELVQDALRRNALRSRDEVIFLLQQVMQDENELAEMAASGDLGVHLIEHLAIELVEVEDLYALAAYDHGDILKKVVLTDEALAVRRRLSPFALRMGGFAAVLFQLLQDELLAHPLPEDPAMGDPKLAAALGADNARVPILRGNLLSITNQLRLFRTAAA